jgi:hypothetical protein
MLHGSNLKPISQSSKSESRTRTVGVPRVADGPPVLVGVRSMPREHRGGGGRTRQCRDGTRTPPVGLRPWPGIIPGYRAAGRPPPGRARGRRPGARRPPTGRHPGPSAGPCRCSPGGGGFSPSLHFRGRPPLPWPLAFGNPFKCTVSVLLRQPLATSQMIVTVTVALDRPGQHRNGHASSDGPGLSTAITVATERPGESTGSPTQARVCRAPRLWPGCLANEVGTQNIIS